MIALMILKYVLIYRWNKQSGPKPKGRGGRFVIPAFAAVVLTGDPRNGATAVRKASSVMRRHSNSRVCDFMLMCTFLGHRAQDIAWLGNENHATKTTIVRILDRGNHRFLSHLRQVDIKKITITPILIFN